jgi:hypothetical protein
MYPLTETSPPFTETSPPSLCGVAETDAILPTPPFRGPILRAAPSSVACAVSLDVASADERGSEEPSCRGPRAAGNRAVPPQSRGEPSRLVEVTCRDGQIMRVDGSFHAAYRRLEERMKALAETDGDVFLPNPEPEGPVQYVLICMEPSLDRWARSAEMARSRVEAGFRNFLFSIADFILHLCSRRTFVGPRSDTTLPICPRARCWSIARPARGPCGMTGGTHCCRRRLSSSPRQGRHRCRWKGCCAAFGATRVRRPFTQVVHYSGQAARTRSAAVVGREESFQAFIGSVSLADVVATAERVLRVAHVPADIRAETLSRLERSQLTTSRQQLIFNYKVAFESMRL